MLKRESEKKSNMRNPADRETVLRAQGKGMLISVFQDFSVSAFLKIERA